MKAGDIWLAQLDPTLGSAIQKTRPCVVISPDEINAHLRTVIVAPMTTGYRPAAFRIPVTFQGQPGLRQRLARQRGLGDEQIARAEQSAVGRHHVAG